MNPQISRPTLLLDETKCRNNISRMAEKAARNHIIFRPHFKTHVSHEIGRWFKEYGVKKITVSSLEMAEYFATDGWNDITVAFPVNICEIELINKLAKKITLNLLVESKESVEFLGNHLRHPVKIFIKIDVGGNRTGIPWQNNKEISDVLNAIKSSSLLTFTGFLTHAGHSYHSSGKKEIETIHEESTHRLRQLKERFGNRHPDLLLSTGDTPTCSIMDDFHGIDEIRPGNFVFFDLMQLKLGSCNIDEIAVVMACPVVAVHPERNELVIYGGAVHFSKDFLLDEMHQPFYGQVVETADPGWGYPIEGMYLKSLSQEHGIIHLPEGFSGKYKPGDLLNIIPVHSCLTGHLAKFYLTTGGKRIGRFC